MKRCLCDKARHRSIRHILSDLSDQPQWKSWMVRAGIWGERHKYIAGKVHTGPFFLNLPVVIQILNSHIPVLEIYSGDSQEFTRWHLQRGSVQLWVQQQKARDHGVSSGRELSTERTAWSWNGGRYLHLEVPPMESGDPGGRWRRGGTGPVVILCLWVALWIYLQPKVLTFFTTVIFTYVF